MTGAVMKLPRRSLSTIGFVEIDFRNAHRFFLRASSFHSKLGNNDQGGLYKFLEKKLFFPVLS